MNRSFASAYSSDIAPGYCLNLGGDIRVIDYLSIRVSAGYTVFAESDEIEYRTADNPDEVSYEGDLSLNRMSNNLNIDARYWLDQLPIAVGLGGSLNSVYQFKTVSDIRALPGTDPVDPQIVGTNVNYTPVEESHVIYGGYAEALYRFQFTDHFGLNTGLIFNYGIFPERENWGGYHVWSLNANVELVYSF